MIPYERLDNFQELSINKLREGINLIVAAPTGTGKTAIVDHIASEILGNGGSIIFTAPLKALCNQKVRDFSQLFGSEKVGLITGDEVVNEKAPLVVMTTEVLRNMLQEGALEEPPWLVVYDEIHYLADAERGAAWEESIVLLPSQTQILGLSATAPNAEEIACWIEAIKGRRTEVVRHIKRAVPLRLYGITKETGIQPIRKVLKKVQAYKGKKAPLFRAATHLEIARELQSKELLPALYFLFNRKKVEAYAYELARYHSFLDREEKRRVREYMKTQEIPEEALPFFERMKALLLKGIGFHHAGLMPQVKRVVEVLFERRLLKVVYCTSTFALGVNMPAKTVCFETVVKYDGRNFRSLTNLEFFQKAGRAGRRGIDEMGYVVVRFDPRDQEEIPLYSENDIEPIESSFRLSYNSVVNLLASRDWEEIEEFLSSSLWSFQQDVERRRLEIRIEAIRREISSLSLSGEVQEGSFCTGRQRATERRKRHLGKRVQNAERELAYLSGYLVREFEGKCEVLQEMGYLGPEGSFRIGAEILRKLHIEELLVAEMILEGMFDRLSPLEIGALLVCIGREHERVGSRMRLFSRKIKREVEELSEYVVDLEERHLPAVESGNISWAFADAGYLWASGESLSHIVESCEVYEGDLISALRQAVDLARQIKKVYTQVPGFRGQKGFQNMTESLDRLERSILREFPL